jgi:phenylacetate-CoA ligase
MPPSTELLALDAFRNAATRVPGYRTILESEGVRAEDVRNLDDFQRLPVLNKATTFQHFDIEELCVDGVLGELGTLLTSSGHSGVFAFGVTNSHALDATTQWVDDLIRFSG